MKKIYYTVSTENGNKDASVYTIENNTPTLLFEVLALKSDNIEKEITLALERKGLAGIGVLNLIKL